MKSEMKSGKSLDWDGLIVMHKPVHRTRRKATTLCGLTLDVKPAGHYLRQSEWVSCPICEAIQIVNAEAERIAHARA